MINTTDNTAKKKLMQQLLNLYEQYEAFPNPIVAEYIAKLEHLLCVALHG